MKVVIAYAVGAWLILQIGEVTFDPLDLPEWSMRLLVLAAICGFPIALLLAWLIDVRPEGLIFDRPFWRKEAAGGGSASWSDVAVGLFLVVMVGTLIYALMNTFMEGPFPEPKEQVYEAENSPPDGSIAVLAFENFDGYQESDYFASGLAEEILNLLADLRVSRQISIIFITHDLDEAVRIGDRIAIMRDGKMVQMGTAEDIVMEPADDYVADFVAGISRLKVVHAHAVMQPIGSYISTHGPINADAQHVKQDETLSTLINLAIDDDNPIVVQSDGKDAGIITRADLLRTVIEGTEVS